MKRWLIPLLLVLLLCGCTAQPSEYETEFFAMDTVMQLHVYGAKNAEGLATASKAASPSPSPAQRSSG